MNRSTTETIDGPYLQAKTRAEQLCRETGSDVHVYREWSPPGKFILITAGAGFAIPDGVFITKFHPTESGEGN